MATYRVLAALHSLLIFALVPLGRPLANLLRSIPLTPELLLTISLVPTLVLIPAAWRSHRRRGPTTAQRSVRAQPLIGAILIVLFGAWYSVDLVELSHLALYGTLSVLLVRGVVTLPGIPSLMLSACILANLVSLTDETLQHLHPQRFFDLRDLVLNFSGALLGLLCAHAFTRIRPQPAPVAMTSAS